MKNKHYFLCACILTSLLSGCGGGSKDTPKPLSDQIRQVWIINVAKENGIVVFTKGGTNNIKPGYTQFKLDLSNTQQQTVRLTEFENSTFAGTWALSANDTKLTLSGLSPQPTGSNGTIEYTVDAGASETTLNLTRASQNPKTGSTNNRYELVK